MIKNTLGISKEQQLKHNKKPNTKNKNKFKNKEVDLLDQSITVRLSKDQVKQRVIFILCKEVCQVCETSMDLDYPHHAIFGISHKDDRTLINICVSCHRTIHTKGYGPLMKTREEIEALGWTNNEEYLND